MTEVHASDLICFNSTSCKLKNFLNRATSDKEVYRTMLHYIGYFGTDQGVGEGLLDIICKDKSLIEGNHKSDNSLMKYFAVKSSPSFVAVLLKKGLEMTSPDTHGCNFIYYAFLYKNYEVVRLMVKRDAKIKCPTIELVELLCRTIREDSVDHLTLLLELGITDLGQLRTFDGLSLLHFAVKQRAKGCIQLLQRSISIHSIDKRGESVIALSERLNDKDVLNLFANQQ